MVRETGDKFRDTVALTVRGDGVDIPPYLIIHTYKNASYASGRRCSADETPIKGMNTPRMIDYIDHLDQYVMEPSLLCLDRLSSHTAKAVKKHLSTKLTADGEEKFIPIYHPTKTSFLCSPLDMGTIANFKQNFYGLDRSTIEDKISAVYQAWDGVSNQSLRNILLNSGVVGEETIQSLRQRWMKEVVGAVPPELEETLDFYDAWRAGYIEVEGVARGRGVDYEKPRQLPEGRMDGVYWTYYNRRFW